MVTLDMDRVSRTYPGEAPVHALIDVRLRVDQGDYVAIEGPSGSGKSTLLNQIALLDTPTSGTYTIDGVETTIQSDVSRARFRSATFAFIFQSFHLLHGRDVVDNVALGTLYRGLAAERRTELALEALGFVGLEHKARQRVENLSGGERQRVAIARAIASGAPVVVADEPTGNLDQASGALVMDTLERLNSQGATVIVVTHDPHVASRARRRLHVLDGHVGEIRDRHLSPALVNNDEPNPRRALAPPGRDSTVRRRDGLADAWRGLWVKPQRTWALIMSVAVGVGLALTTTGLAQTARFQVSEIFDAQRNQRVALTSSMLQGSGSLTQTAVSAESFDRVSSLAGVDSAAVFVTHGSVSISTRPAARPDDLRLYQVTGLVEGKLPSALFGVDTQGATIDSLAPGEVVLGGQLAQELNLGPLLASPAVWIHGEPHIVVGVLTDAGLQVGLMSSIIVTESEAAELSAPEYASVEIKVAPGAAPQVAEQAPVAWIPQAPESVQVNAPPDPTTLRDQIESNLATMLLTLTGVALLAAVLSLTNAMSTAVFQRTGEFGLRRAIGARRVHITALVLTESLAIGVLGGIIGAYSSVLIILGVTIARQWQPVLDPWTLPLGILGGIGMGLVGGLVATMRASQIEPSDALRS